ncbi:MAG: hypothetical protein QNJ40_09875 [Xanthomonadales bacterium]|nr:hypothetical protein [Xanthomonadales bacterium]
MSFLSSIKQRLTTWTLVSCGLTCVAYEAIRINGRMNRFASQDPSFWEIAFSRWESFGLVVYFSIFTAALVVICNRSNPRIAMAWFAYSVLILGIACFNIPGAMMGRYGDTYQVFALFHLVITPLPAIVFILVGLITGIRDQGGSV